MSIRVVTYGTRPASATGRRAARPEGIDRVIAEHEKKIQPQVDKAEAEAKRLREEAKLLQKEAMTLSGPAKQAKLDEARAKREAATKAVDDAMGQFMTDVYRVSGASGRQLLFKSEARPFYESDAGHAIPATANATLWMVEFGYGVHRGREAFLTDVPTDGKVTFNVINTPSGHDGEARFNDYARTNRYVAEIWHQPPQGAPRRIERLDYGVTKGPEYATMSPEVTLDLNQLKGKIIIRGWAQGSAGHAGYIERRETTINNP